MPNRIKIALPLYGPVYPKFLIAWLGFQSQIARCDHYAGVTVTETAPVDLGMNEIVKSGLEDKSWDYLVVVEHDMVPPPDLLEKVAALDPATHPIVGCLYFGRAQDNQAPIPGFWINERLHRLSYEQACAMLPERGGVAGLHRVDTVGMGYTAIHRSVFERWPWTPSHPWFRFDYDHMGPIGHDVWFCREAGRQGYPIYVDSSLIAGHIGDWVSTSITYLATTEHAQRIASTASTQAPGVLLAFTAGGLKDETLAAAKATDLLVELRELHGDDGYHNLIAEAWADGETFLTLEQDIVPEPGQLEELAACPEPWCAFEYEYPPFGFYAGMGCAKFSRDLVARFPDALTETGRIEDATHPPKHWCRVDGWLKQYLVERGVRQHIHGRVRHLHKDRPAHGCVVIPLPRDIPSALTDAEAHHLEKLATGKRVLEMGAHLGFSTVVMARVAAELVSVDWHQGDEFAGRGDTEDAFRANLRSHGVEDRVQVHVGRFEDVLWKLDPGFDLIFIDGAHDYESVKRDFKLARPLLAAGGIIALHDYGRHLPNFGVTEFAQERQWRGSELIDTLLCVRSDLNPYYP